MIGVAPVVYGTPARLARANPAIERPKASAHAASAPGEFRLTTAATFAASSRTSASASADAANTASSAAARSAGAGTALPHLRVERERARSELLGKEPPVRDQRIGVGAARRVEQVVHLGREQIELVTEHD